MFEKQLVSAVQAFRSELILISAGFDSRKGDQLGCFDVSDAGFVQLTEILKALADEFCDGRIVSVLEGGYTLSGLASATVAHVNALNS